MVKDILICLEGSPSTQRAIEVAIGFARDLPAALVGLAIVDEPDIRAGEPTSIGGASYKQQRDESLLADAHKNAQQWLDAFAARCLAAGVSARVLELRGTPAKTILAEMQRHDLVVLGREVNFRYETEETDEATRDAILRRAGKPVVIVPDGDLAQGRAALICYDGSAAARRALESFAKSGLQRERPVHVAAIDDDGATAWDIAQHGCKLLADLGVAASAHNIVTTLPIVDALREQRAKLDAGLIVMGAYRRSKFGRLLWGSVTEAMVEKTVVPLFLHY
jgi:nucleotide-binding universal stress UspA family protein